MNSLAANAGTEGSLSARAEPLPKRRSELKARVLSAAVLGALALLATYLGGLPFAIFVAAMSAVALWEWIGISAADQPVLLRAASVFCLVAGLLALAFSVLSLAVRLLVLPVVVALGAAIRFPPAGWIGLGLIYVAFPAAAFLMLRGSEPNGFLAILLMLAIVAASDTGAYFGGRRFGGPKLWTRVSPKKTWSGALCGLVSAALAGAALGSIIDELRLGFLLGVVLSIAGQAGDLLESAVKRHFGVKDSGRILPGTEGSSIGSTACSWLRRWAG
jgi:phosphatidate cytidylyltransferase